MKQQKDEEEKVLEQDKPEHYEGERKEPFVIPGIAGHEWRQQGPMLVCKSCPISHAQHIGLNVRLVGFKDGMPILTKLEDAKSH
jgi:hypothetical protein